MNRRKFLSVFGLGAAGAALAPLALAAPQTEIVKLRFSNYPDDYDPFGQVLTVSCDRAHQPIRHLKLSITDIMWTDYARQEAVHSVKYLGLPLTMDVAIAMAKEIREYMDLGIAHRHERIPLRVNCVEVVVPMTELQLSRLPSPGSQSARTV